MIRMYPGADAIEHTVLGLPAPVHLPARAPGELDRAAARYYRRVILTGHWTAPPIRSMAIRLLARWERP